jgi:hypothetical protein
MHLPNQDGMAAINGMAQHDWAEEFNYACPPVALLDHVVSIIIQQAAPTILIMPNWPGSSWFKEAAEEASDFINLGTMDKCFHPGPSGRAGPANGERWTFLALLITPTRVHSSIN